MIIARHSDKEESVIVEKLCGPMSVMLSRRNLRFVLKRARKFRGNKSEAMRRIIDAAEERDRKAKQRKR